MLAPNSACALLREGARLCQSARDHTPEEIVYVQERPPAGGRNDCYATAALIQVAAMILMTTN